MHLKYQFEMMELDDRVVAVPVGDGADEFHGVVKLSETAAFIFNLLKNDISENEIIDAMEKEFDATRCMLASDVRACIEDFTKKGLLEYGNNT